MNEFSDRLMASPCAEAFLKELNGAASWRLLAALKADVDDLVGSDMRAAERLASRVSELAALLGDARGLAFGEAGRARVLQNLGRHTEAEALYESAIAALRSARLPGEAAYIRMQQSAALMHAGRYDEALRAAQSARRHLARGEPARLAQLENNLGNIYYRLDRYRKALAHYDRARQILHRLGDRQRLAILDFSRSNVLADLDRPEEALRLLESAAATMKEGGRALFAAQARLHIAYLQFSRGLYNTALASYYRVREELNELGSHQLVAFATLEIAEVLLALNAFDDAAENAAAARARMDELGLPYDAARAAMVEALAALGGGHPEQARQALLGARALFDATGNKTFAALADAYLAEVALRGAAPDEAAHYAERSLKVFARQKLAARAAYTRLLAARAAYAAGDRRRALRMARGALRAAENFLAPAVAYQAHHLVGRIERDRGRRAAALDNFRRAVEALEQMRGGIVADEFKATFLHDKIGIYEDAIAACLDRADLASVEEAFRLVEASKSRALADLLARYVREEAAPSRRGPSAETRARLAQLIEELNWYSANAGREDDKGEQRNAEVAERYRRAVLRCERQIARLFHRLEAEDADFAEIQRMQPASAEDLRTALRTDETAIEFFNTGDRLSAFVVSADGMRVVRDLAARRDVENLLAAFRFQIEKFNYGPEFVEANFSALKRVSDGHLAQLYGLCFAPLAAHVATPRVIIIPHGALHYVPFHALRDGTTYLIDRYEFSYAPSAAVLKLCRARRDALAQGGAPAGDKEGLVALGVVEAGTPNIEDEIRALQSIFPGAVSLLGDAATRDNLMRFVPEARFLHLASHGYFRRDNPMFSFLKLADAPLNFYSLLDLKLKAELVTLSACHTGVNMVFPGDELHGLMRGFLYAGAPSLVASLWAVSDRSTAELMQRMYVRLRAGDAKRAALRDAQLAVKDAYGHPYYWAPFVLMGEPE